MQKYIDLMRIDLLTMNGDKNSMRSMLILLFIGSIAGEIFISPIFGFIGMLMVGSMIVVTWYQSQSKYHAAKLFGLLPVSRKDIVTARFMLFIGLFIAMSIVMYAFMELSLVLGIHKEITGDLQAVLEKMGADIGFDSACRLGFFVFFYFGLLTVASSLKGYFTNPTAFETAAGLGTSVSKMNAKGALKFIVVLIVVIAVSLFFSGILYLGTAGAVIMQLFVQLFTAGGGLMFGLVMITLAGFSAYYNYICTVIAYEDAEI